MKRKKKKKIAEVGAGAVLMSTRNRRFTDRKKEALKMKCRKGMIYNYEIIQLVQG